ncbi:uncharacterized protein [Choristoneura fumiferana]|uniref:uncharacterized protein n=1 Tax=Choristoneura fumiferana TaxID=7141 RepID=UPI003D15F18F
MRGEAPRFKRCCFCIPLRRGLLGWGYLMLVLNILKAILFTVLYFEQIIILLPSIIILIVDVIFNVLLIVACHKKSPKLMKMYFVYGVVVVILIFASTSAMIYDDVQRAVSTWDTSYNGFADIAIRVVATPAMCFVDIFIYIYVLFLVRSERIKLLEQNLEIQFVNNGAEAESYCVCVADAATCARDDHGSSLKATDALCDA